MPSSLTAYLFALSAVILSLVAWAAGVLIFPVVVVCTLILALILCCE
jgi:hypothetical protein